MGGGGGGEGGKIGVAKNVNNIGKMEAARMFYRGLISVVFALLTARTRSLCVCARFIPDRSIYFISFSLDCSFCLFGDLLLFFLVFFLTAAETGHASETILIFFQATRDTYHVS